MSKIILIVGPTGTGKTKLSIELSHTLNAEIINADSTQIYKEPCISTAKITEEEKEGITHHMIDLVSLNDDYTLYDYQKEARKVLDKLISENKNVIIVGGSGLYVKALLYNYNLSSEIKKNIDLSIYSNEELKSMADKIFKNDIHVNNRQRLERFITKYNNTSIVTTKSEEINSKLYNFTSIGLTAPREILYQKINDRVDKMINNGLLKEAKELYELNLKNYNNIIDLKELVPYFKNEISLEEAKEQIKKDTRHYAKRQLTWFNNQMKDIKWFNTDYDNFTNTINEVKEYIKL
jgi:tRNA dimethylallyltransferase